MAILSLILSYYTVSLVIFFLLILHIWYRYKFSYWASKGVFGPTPVFPFGHVLNVIKRKSQFFDPYCESYFKYRHLPYVGLYTFHRPVLSINDPEIAKLVLISDFDHFEAHGIFSGGVGDPLAGHLFNLSGNPWRKLRSKMSSTFTPGKLKTMYPLVENIAGDALTYADVLQSNGESVNFSELYAKYAMEIVGSVGFGVNCNGFKDSKSQFFNFGNEYFEPKNAYWTFARALAFFTPDLFNILKMNRICPKIIQFFFNLVKETVEFRHKNSFKRNDFLQTLIDLKNQKPFEDDTKVTEDIPFSMTDVAANTMLYLFAGYETSATTGQFAAYELAVNPHIQTKAREEITRVLANHGGVCTYEAQVEMIYLNMVLDETMRKYPPMRALFRRCTEDFTFPNNLVLEKGTLLFIPIHAIQNDPQIFPDPDKFDPERFTAEKKAKMHPCHWMPFGEGPRKCLGLRQGYIQSKMALVKILEKYELILDERTELPIRLKPSALACTVQGGIWIQLKPLQR